MSPKVLARHGMLAGAILITGCLALSACSSGITATSGASSAGFSGRAPAAQPANGAASGTGGGSAGQLGRQSASQIAALTPVSQGIIYTASLTVRSADVAAATQRATGIARAAGGYISDEHQVSGTPGGGQQVSLTMKIPVPGYQAALAQLSSPALGKQLSMQQQATDVTQQVADVNSLVTSQQAAIKALQGLLAKAASVSGLLTVQQQISSDESSLNSLQAQQRALDDETSYATVTMTLFSPHHAAAHKKKQTTTRRGFLAGLSAGWRALRHATDWTLTVLGAVLPIGLILVLLAGGSYAAWRRFGRRVKPTAAA